MKTREFKEKTNQELRGLLRTMNEELFNARFQHYNGQLENTQKLPALRRQIATVRTLLRQRELGITRGPEEAAPVGRKE